MDLTLISRQQRFETPREMVVVAHSRGDTHYEEVQVMALMAPEVGRAEICFGSF
jgi:hypothetical protein